MTAPRYWNDDEEYESAISVKPPHDDVNEVIGWRELEHRRDPRTAFPVLRQGEVVTIWLQDFECISLPLLDLLRAADALFTADGLLQPRRPSRVREVLGSAELDA
jgi:hypothetical protein